MIKDNMSKQKFNSTKLPELKGHIKLTLRDAETGKIEKVVEGENIVTNAIRDIFACNYLGGIGYGSMMPLYQKWFGGILCYRYAHPTDENDQLDPDNYYPKNNDNNPLTAHAGDVTPTNNADDARRGQPNLNLQVITPNSIKLGWEWGTTQGNGKISSLSLTHADTGNAGLGSASNAFSSFSPFAAIQGSQLPGDTVALCTVGNAVAQYDENHSLDYYIGEDGDFYYAHSRFATKKVTIYIRRMAYEKAGLFDTLTARSTDQQKFTVTTTATFYNEPSFYFDYENKILWLFTNLTSVNTYDTDDINYEKIPCPAPYDPNNSYVVGDYTCHNDTLYKCTSPTTGTFDAEDWTDTFTLEHGTLHSDTANIAPLSMDKDPGSGWDSDHSAPRFANIVFDGTYFYFPTANSVAWGEGTRTISSFNVTGLKLINPSDSSDQDTITFSSSQRQFRYAMLGGELLINNGRVVNGATGYTCSTGSLVDDNSDTYPVFAFHQPYRVATLASYRGGAQRSGTVSRYILANKMVNTTLFNLVDQYGQPMTVEKLPTQAMTIEYTLTEVADTET